MAGHEELSELLGAYALDAVTGEERRILESHLRGCDECRTEVLEHLEVAAGLGARAATPPPPDLWDRITNGLDDMSTGALGEPLPLPRLRLFDAGPTSPTAPPLFSSNPSRSGRRGRDRARHRTTTRVRVALVAAAAAVAVMVLGIGLVDVTLRRSSTPVQVAADAAMADPANQRIELASSIDDARAVAVITPTGEGFMVPDKWAALPEDRTYQLWEIGTAGAVSLGVLGNEPGPTAFHVNGPVPTLAVTNEVAGGAPAPHGAPVLTGTA